MGGWGVGVGSKVFAQKAPSSGEAYSCPAKRQSNGNAADCNVLGRRFESWSVDSRRRRRNVRFPGLEPPTIKTPVSCSTIRQLLALRRRMSPLSDLLLAWLRD